MRTEVLKNSSNDVVVENTTQDKDIIIRGDDGGVSVDPLKFDVSENIAIFGTNTKIATGNETAPNGDPGSITINHGANDGDAFIIKNSDVNNPFTSLFQADDYALFRKRSSGSGGLNVIGISDGDTTALRLSANIGTNTPAASALDIQTAKSDGAGDITAIADTEIMLDIDNNTARKMRMYGNGRTEFKAGGINTKISTANVSNPPTDAELDSEFGAPATVASGFIALVDDAGAGSNFYLVASDGTNWWHFTGTKAV
jgi:hypothetical protein